MLSLPYHLFDCPSEEPARIARFTKLAGALKIIPCTVLRELEAAHSKQRAKIRVPQVLKCRIRYGRSWIQSECEARLGSALQANVEDTVIQDLWEGQ